MNIDKNLRGIMKARWKLKDVYEGLPFLLIEAEPIIQEAYFHTKEQLRDKGVLILGIDGPGLLDKKDRDVLSAQFAGCGIQYESVDNFFWIDDQQKDVLFGETDFGSSGDTCFFLSKKPAEFPLRTLPRMKGVFRRRFSPELLEILEKYPETVYMSVDHPYTAIVTKDVGYLEALDRQVSVGEAQ